MIRPAHISVDDFFKPPVRAAASISPDGTRVAYLAPWRDRLNIWVQGLNDGAEPRRVTADETRSVLHFSWTDDPRWLLYLQDAGGDENWHIMRVDLDDPEAQATDLTPFPGAMSAFELLPEKPGKALVHSNKRSPTQMDAYELDIASGELTLLAENPGDVVGWLASRRGDLFATKLNQGGDLEVLEWVGGSLRSIAHYDGKDYTMGIYPMVVTPDGGGIWMGSNEGTDRTRLVRLDVADGKQYAVDSHPRFDIDTCAQVWPGLPEPLIQSRATGELLGVRYLHERQVIQALDPHFADVLSALGKLSDGDIGALSCDNGGTRWIVSFTHDRDPGATYFYDHDTGDSRLLFRPFPHLDPEQLAPMLPVTIPSRDGLELHSYLTLPIGVEPRNLPLVLTVHGGPWARDRWMYNPGVQLLANRGYAVLQVNFRGSAGYGKAFQKAAIGEFAGKMHDDLIDGVEWAIEQGYANRERVAILGGSYGGYATLVGVTFTPDVFAAAIDYVGISDLSNFMRTLPEVARPHLANNWHLFVGNPDDPEELADMLARSPITKLDQITTPLLVIQGANDVRVVQAESDKLVEGLRARGVEVEYMVKEDEGHGFVNPNNTIDMWNAVDRFLEKHL
ncbi:S9 family peptidase [Mycolicibacterium aichiense]|uniref:Peptidase n=1 Tax=Mycolicibacterium aichiense TaxID=1799 RepID=A0AAD1HR49_9MYCO|nr:S9 family peptidase [Mycolicibacterium aichiense]MCV7016506.1 S9 family peptidase [Mycolicibacterium aichiense]BBX09715.1 peptidase [Mycolicibacterium aichiense]SUA14280.1 peptidase S9 prolyl oligopeptidase [Mycolicibacterium aichiense]